MSVPRGTLLLSVDFEDWHQLVRRRAGDARWDRPGPALERQTESTLARLDGLGVRATFFVLGVAARAHPELVAWIRDAGHEIACHGDQHRPVHSQTPEQFAADLRAARQTIEQLAGEAPRGYRAPAFSILRQQAGWARAALVREGFAYDASECDSFMIRGRVQSAACGPRLLEGGLWELPVAVWRAGPLHLPVGGASYWSLAPTRLVLRGLGNCPGGGLYLHPHELDPEPLAPLLAGGAGIAARARVGLRTARRNLARRRAVEVLDAIAAEYRLITYGEAHARLGAGIPART
jgi:peptidoglycan/xylan/chitin deacetylase (PgdA/CDA1 family)